MKRNALLFIAQLFLSASLSAQTDSLSIELTSESPKKLQVSGYIKDLNTIGIPNIKGDWTFDNQIHSRLKLRYTPFPHLTVLADMRNRLFFGESIKNSPLFVEQTTKINDFVKLGGIVFQEKSVLLHTVFDRVNLDFQKNNWQITVGKQRVNWAKTYIWNPNDIFNAYSFFDFDYEERQGTDAVLIRRYLGSNASFEFVSNIQNSWDKTTFATLYKFNRKATDYQILVGKKDSTWVIGGGWAGQIKNAGFKGEMTYFRPNNGEKGTFVGDISLDYAFPNTLNFKLETIISTNPTKSNAFVFLTKPVTANALINNYFSIFGAIGYDITPLITTNLSSIWNVDDASFFLNPTLNLNLNDNTDLLLAAQILAGKQGSLFADVGSFVFMRLKWGF